MKKILPSFLLVILSNLAFAQQPFNPFMESFEDVAKKTLSEYFQDWFVKSTVTSKKNSSKGKFTFGYEFTDTAIIIYEHTVFGSSAADATYSDKWFYIPLEDLYLSTNEANIESFNESTEITLSNKLNRVIAGNGTKYNLKDENTYLQTSITFPFLLQRKDNQNSIDNENSILYRLNFFINLLRGVDYESNTTSAEKPVALKHDKNQLIGSWDLEHISFENKKTTDDDAHKEYADLIKKALLKNGIKEGYKLTEEDKKTVDLMANGMASLTFANTINFKETYKVNKEYMEGELSGQYSTTSNNLKINWGDEEEEVFEIVKINAEDLILKDNDLKITYYYKKS